MSDEIERLDVVCQRLEDDLSTLRASLAKAEAALANISGALVDSGLPVPDEGDYHKAVRALTAERDRLREAARHIVELGYDHKSPGARWCRFCGRNPVNGHMRKLDGDLRPCPLGELEKALFTAPVVAQPVSAPSAHGAAGEDNCGRCGGIGTECWQDTGTIAVCSACHGCGKGQRPLTKAAQAIVRALFPHHTNAFGKPGEGKP